MEGVVAFISFPFFFFFFNARKEAKEMERTV